MFKRHFKLLLISFLFYLSLTPLFAEVVEKIEIQGNERISKETILLFSKINIKDDLNSNDINEILKSLYDTNFFLDVSVEFKSKILTILVDENPIIENITYNGIKSKTLKEKITKDLKLLSLSLIHI